MTDSIKITINSNSTTNVQSRMDTWAASYTSSEAMRKSIVKRTLLAAAFDERFVDTTMTDADLRKLFHQVAKDMIAEPPVPMAPVDDDKATSPAE